MQTKFAVICILVIILGSIVPIYAQDVPPLTPPYREMLLPDHGTVSAVAWNHDVENPVLAIAVDAPAVLIWDINSDEVIGEFPLDHLITVLDWSADDQHLLAGTELGDVLAWDVASSDLTTILTLPEKSITAVRWSQTEGEVLVAATAGGTQFIYRWNIAQQAFTEEIEMAIYDLTTPPTWSHDEKYLLTGNLNGEVKVCEVATGNIILDYQVEAMILGLDWSEDDSKILYTPIGGGLQVWDIPADDLPKMGMHYTGAHPEYDLMEGGTWNADETLVLAGSNTGTGSAYGWDAATGELIFKLEIGQVLFNTFRVNEGTLLTAAQSDFENGTTIRVWDFAEYVEGEAG